MKAYFNKLTVIDTVVYMLESQLGRNYEEVTLEVESMLLFNDDCEEMTFLFWVDSVVRNRPWKSEIESANYEEVLWEVKPTLLFEVDCEQSMLEFEST